MTTSPTDFILPLDLPGGVPRAIPIAYYVICGLCFVVIVASFIVQFTKPAQYGKFDQPKATSATPASNSTPLLPGEGNSGTNNATSSTATAVTNGNNNNNNNSPAVDDTASCCRIPQRVAHILSDFPPTVIVMPILFFTAANIGQPRSNPSYVMLALWLCHYIHRGLIHPLTMRYSAELVELGICLGGLFPNLMFSVAFAFHISLIDYGDGYFYDPRFIIGVVMFVFGYVANRWSDWHLRSLRENQQQKQKEQQQQQQQQQIVADGAAAIDGTSKKQSKYVLPTEGLFALCFCPNYFGEFVEWCGFAILTSSLVGVLFALFGLSTFMPRSLATKRWYLATFPEADPNKAALIPKIL